MIRTEDLGIAGLKIIQDPELFCFGTDSVLLSDFARASNGDTVVDLCTGGGIIPVLMSAKTKAKKFYGIELQTCSFDLCRENIMLNSLDDRIEAINADIKDVLLHFKSGSVDVVTCNPPYMNAGAGFLNPDDALAIARHEIKTNLKGVVDAAASILKFGGHFYMVHRADRLCDIISTMRTKNIEPKRIAFVHPSPQREPKLILVDGILGANPSLKIETPIYVNI
jgi:tRNA1Val (adenine37-N6)-methyltransferase